MGFHSYGYVRQPEGILYNLNIIVDTVHISSDSRSRVISARAAWSLQLTHALTPLPQWSRRLRGKWALRSTPGDLDDKFYYVWLVVSNMNFIFHSKWETTNMVKTTNQMLSLAAIDWPRWGYYHKQWSWNSYWTTSIKGRKRFKEHCSNEGLPKDLPRATPFSEMPISGCNGDVMGMEWDVVRFVTCVNNSLIWVCPKPGDSKPRDGMGFQLLATEPSGLVDGLRMETWMLSRRIA